MYSILEKDKGKRISFTARNQDREEIFQWKLTGKEENFRERTACA